MHPTRYPNYCSAVQETLKETGESDLGWVSLLGEGAFYTIINFSITPPEFLVFLAYIYVLITVFLIWCPVLCDKSLTEEQFPPSLLCSGDRSRLNRRHALGQFCTNKARLGVELDPYGFGSDGCGVLAGQPHPSIAGSGLQLLLRLCKPGELFSPRNPKQLIVQPPHSLIMTESMNWLINKFIAFYMSTRTPKAGTSMSS